MLKVFFLLLLSMQVFISFIVFIFLIYFFSYKEALTANGSYKNNPTIVLHEQRILKSSYAIV